MGSRGIEFDERGDRADQVVMWPKESERSKIIEGKWPIRPPES
jgi:hypothetical protein